MNLATKKNIIYSVALILCGLIFTACQETTPVQTTDTSFTIPSVVSPNVDARVNELAAANQLVTTAIGTNLLSNGSFTGNYDSWTSCGGNTQISHLDNNSFPGMVTLKGGCMYQSVEVSPNRDYSVSCDVNPSTNGVAGWSGMGIGISNSSWNSIAQASPSVISGRGQIEFSATVRAPSNSKYATLWIYSDESILIDNCVLGQGIPDAPTGNLLSDADFGATGDSGTWTSCGGTYFIVNGILRIRSTACLYQVVNARDGLDYELSCNGQRNSDVWASATLAMLDSSYNITSSSSEPISTSYGTGPSIYESATSNTKYAAVVLYGEGTTDIQSCDLRASE